MLEKYIDHWAMKDSDHLKFHYELRRLKKEDKIPNCYPHGTRYLKEFEHIRTNTIMSGYAYCYLDMLIKSEETPEMTLKEYLEL